MAFSTIYDHPSICTEWDAGPPHEYPYEITVMMASAGSLQGWDTLFQFSEFSEDWKGRVYFSPYFTTGLHCPNVQLIHPACSLIFRRQDVKEAPIVYEHRVTKERALNGVLEDGEYDVPLEACVVGKVGVRFVNRESSHFVTDCKKYIDTRSGRVKSVTGELRWNYKQGKWVIDTPRTQGICGEIDSKISTGDVEFDIASPYGVVLVSSLTNEPIRSSRKILIAQVGRNLNNGARYNLERNVLEEEGDYPVLLERLRGRIALRLDHPAVQVIQCDPNGKPIRSTIHKTRNHNLDLTLPLNPPATYIIIKTAR